MSQCWVGLEVQAPTWCLLTPVWLGRGGMSCHSSWETRADTLVGRWKALCYSWARMEFFVDEMGLGPQFFQGYVPVEQLLSGAFYLTGLCISLSSGQTEQLRVQAVCAPIGAFSLLVYPASTWAHVRQTETLDNSLPAIPQALRFRARLPSPLCFSEFSYLCSYVCI